MRAKKTQRDKDWPMIRRLVEANYFANRDHPTSEQLRFWFHELRTPQLLADLSHIHPASAQQAASSRPLIHHAMQADIAALADALANEEQMERTLDSAYCFR